jgi:hypothetical protein
MIIRTFRPDDIVQLKEIHERYYKEEFSLQDFCSSFMDFFVMVDDDKIISAGGVRAIAESVIMTDKSAHNRTKYKALVQMLQAQTFTCNKRGFNQLHAFVQDKDWENHLKKFGFRNCKGHPLFIEV